MGSSPTPPAKREPTTSVIPKIVRVLLKLKSSGMAETTLEGISKRLKMLSKHCDLDNPEQVKAFIAGLHRSNGYKENLADAYDHYVVWNGLCWKKPKFVREEKAIRVPSTEHIEQLIACSGAKYSMIISIFKETGARPCELERVRLRDVDLEKGIIYLPSRKGSKGRAKQLKPNTLAMLKRHIATNNFKLNDCIFPTSKAMTKSFTRHRNKLAEKLQDSAIKTIRLYDLRHYYATMLYHKTKDILYVKEQLGHKRLENTLVYTHLVDFGSEEWICRVAKTVEEATQLIEAGFEYVTEMEGLKLFRKRK